jgi:hypothetical protein
MPFQLGNPYAAIGAAKAVERQRHDRALTRALVHECEQVDSDGPDKGRNQYTKIARKLIKEVTQRGNVEAAKLIWTRIEGLPRQDVNMNLSGAVAKQITANMPIDELSNLYEDTLRYIENEDDSFTYSVTATEVPANKPDLGTSTQARPRPATNPQGVGRIRRKR